MNLHITHHARQRMAERNITERSVERTISSGLVKSNKLNTKLFARTLEHNDSTHYVAATFKRGTWVVKSTYYRGEADNGVC